MDFALSPGVTDWCNAEAAAEEQQPVSRLHSQTGASKTS